MSDFTPSRYGATVTELVDPQRLNDLGPGHPNENARTLLANLSAVDLFAGEKIVDEQMADCCLSGLWLWHDFLDESHTISQSIDTTSGSYWHGIMHRREEDFSNAKYWFRKVGEHAIFPQLAAAARERAAAFADAAASADLAKMNRWDPFHFVDLCAACRRDDGGLKTLYQEIARDEWQLLFDYCYRSAIGQ